MPSKTPSLSYENFDLLITPAQTGYQARVLYPPLAQTTHAFNPPFSQTELARIQRLSPADGRGVFLLEEDDSPPIPPLDAKSVGKRLFDALFTGAIGTGLFTSLLLARQQGKGLRIRLRMNDVPELAGLPWEYLYNTNSNDFLALSTQTPLVRYLELMQALDAFAVTPPLRILAILSGPADLPPLQIEKEWSALQAVLEPLQQQVITERLVQPTLDALQRRLRQLDQPVHILHFIGHGSFDVRKQVGGLYFETTPDPKHYAGITPVTSQPIPHQPIPHQPIPHQFVSAEQLAGLLRDHRSLRLVFLNACEGAINAQDNIFQGLAQTLAQKGIPAVIAMQYTVSDRAAIQLASEFYAALADGFPVDAALAEGRKKVTATPGNMEWGTPVLFMRVEDGILWQIQQDTTTTDKDTTNKAKEEPQTMSEKTQGENKGQKWWEQLVSIANNATLTNSSISVGNISRGDTISANIGAGAKNVAVGKNITQTVTEVLGPPAADDKPLIEAKFQQITLQLNQLAIDAKLIGKAEAHVETLQAELTKTAANETPDAAAVQRAGDWLINNVPSFTAALGELFVMPAVGRVLGKAGEGVVKWVKSRF